MLCGSGAGNQGYNQFDGKLYDLGNLRVSKHCAKGRERAVQRLLPVTGVPARVWRLWVGETVGG